MHRCRNQGLFILETLLIFIHAAQIAAIAVYRPYPGGVGSRLATFIYVAVVMPHTHTHTHILAMPSFPTPLSPDSVLDVGGAD